MLRPPSLLSAGEAAIPPRVSFGELARPRRRLSDEPSLVRPGTAMSSAYAADLESLSSRSQRSRMSGSLEPLQPASATIPSENGDQLPSSFDGSPSPGPSRQEDLMDPERYRPETEEDAARAARVLALATRLPDPQHKGHNKIMAEFKRLGVMCTYDAIGRSIDHKHIPASIKLNEPEVRLHVLAGLIDSDGSYNSLSRTFNFSQVRDPHETLFWDTVFMARSLGMHCTISVLPAHRTWSDSLKQWINAKEGLRAQLSRGIERIPTHLARKRGTQAVRQDEQGALLSRIQTINRQRGKLYTYGFELEFDEHLCLLHMGNALAEPPAKRAPSRYSSAVAEPSSPPLPAIRRLVIRRGARELLRLQILHPAVRDVHLAIGRTGSRGRSNRPRQEVSSESEGSIEDFILPVLEEDGQAEYGPARGGRGGAEHSRGRSRKKRRSGAGKQEQQHPEKAGLDI